MDLEQFDEILVKNKENIQYRLTDKWRNKINEELKMQQVGKAFNNEFTTEGEIENHIIKINYFIRNKLNAQLKRILDNSIVFITEFWQKFAPVQRYTTASD